MPPGGNGTCCLTGVLKFSTSPRVRLLGDRIKSLCEARRIRLTDLLREAGVSRTAYYSLLRKETVLPKSLVAIARRLKVRPSTFLGDNGNGARGKRGGR